jgi:hypothetical protein
LSEYKRANFGIETVAHPDSVKGLPAKRQWIADKFGDVFMVDDDIANFIRLYNPPYRRDSKMTAEDARAAVEATYKTAIDIGAYLFSLAPHGDNRLFIPQKPFRLTGYINGAAFGLRSGSKLRFNSEAVAVADYILSGMNAFHHRYLFIDERFGFRQKNTFSSAGGLGATRTAETEIKDTALLRRMFGPAVIEKQDNRRKNQKTGTVSGRGLRFPF